jgi:transcriptional regulator with XRE-family HTH domain
MTTLRERVFAADLEARRRKLDMPIEALVKRSGVSRATVRRILSGDHTGASFIKVLAVAEALGLEVRFDTETAEEAFRERQAVQKARRLVGLVQGTSGLEAQAVDPAAVECMVQRTTHELLSGSKKKLWSD